MVEDSVDDMYFGCLQTMNKKVKQKYLDEEKYSKKYAEAWVKAKKCFEDKKKFVRGEDKTLTEDHLLAICLYTSEQASVYKEFNAAVRTERDKYTSSFQFHSLHFLLTTAIRILNNNNYCHTAYRRVRDRFTGSVNQIIRFGTFTSSSYKTNLRYFGNETCFKIKTCSGAFLKKYSAHKYEEEVLIPPYEMFNITNKIDAPVKIDGLNDCKVLYFLESAGDKSSLNCKLIH